MICTILKTLPVLFVLVICVNRTTMRQRHYVQSKNNHFEGFEKIQTLKSNRFSSSNKVFGLCIAFRALNSLLIQTYFNPDEHWQALEVAHRITFGYGHLTWEWEKGIRSYLHPMVFSILYKVLEILHLDTPWFMMKAPRFLQSLFSSVGDLYVYKLSDALFGHNVAQWAIFSQLANWFVFFSFTRTLSNSSETVLTLVGLYYWPCMRASSKKEVSRKHALAIAALACAIRPTSAIIWIYVGLLELFVARDKLKFILLEVVPVGVLVIGVTCLLDRLMHGSWIFVSLNFLKFNLFSSGGDYYGTHKWHWYLTQGFPVMVFTFFPFTIYGIIISKHWKLFGLIAWVLGLYSLLGHKEFRFVMPVLPLALMFAGYTISALKTRGCSKNTMKGSSNIHSKFPSYKNLAIIFLLVTNIPVALYMSLVHQRGTEDVINYLSKEAFKGKVKRILFLMPCHTTPYYSSLHQDLPMRFLDCSPSEVIGAIDESDRFMMDPLGFMTDFVNYWSIPSHIVLFDSEEKRLKELLVSHSFREIKRFFHAHFKVDRHLQASVVVYSSSGQ